MTRTLRLLLPLALLVLPLAADAVEIPLPGKNRTMRLGLSQFLATEYHSDVDELDGNESERYVDFKNRTDLMLMHGTTTFNIRFDFHVFAGDHDVAYRRATYSLEKISLSSVQRSFEVAAGDFHIRIGRGLALDLTRLDDLSRDTTLRGAMIKVRFKWIDGQVFGGWVNPLEMDGLNEIPVWVPSDVIGGGRIEVRPFPALAIGLHYVGSGMESRVFTTRNAGHILGASVELPNLLKKLSVYGEYDFISRADEISVEQGHGTYLGITANLGALAGLVEFKFYRRFELKNPHGDNYPVPIPPELPWRPPQLLYHRPPTLMWKKQQVLNNHDVIGPRIRLDYRVERWNTNIWASYGHFFRSDAAPDTGFFEMGASVNDVFGGLQIQHRRGSLDLTGGYRVDTLDRDGEKITDFSHAFAEAELSVQVYKQHSVEFEALYRKIEKVAESFWDVHFSVGYRPSKYFSGAVIYEHTTEYSNRYGDLPAEISPRRHFGGVTGTANITPSTYVRLFAGSTAGGERCIDGQCTYFPPFIGARLTLVAQF